MSKKKPRSTTKVKSDKNEDKKFPNGISATILSIQYYWENITNGAPEGITPNQFCDLGFRETYRSIIETYRGIGKRADPDKTDQLPKSIHFLCNGTQDLHFYQLRAFAEYLGIPTGLFLLFTQMVSDERRILESGRTLADAQQHAIEFIRKLKVVFESAENQIDNAGRDERIFTHVYDNEGIEHMAKARTLKIWTDSYQAD